MKDSRILKEWLDANGNKINIVNSASATSNKTSGDFTEKFKKLYSHIDSVWGGLNIIRCAAHTLAIYYGYGQKWYHLIIRYIPEEGCFEINLSERRPSDKLIYAGEADSWAELLDILMQTETINNRKLCEWVDANGNRVNHNTQSVINNIPTKIPTASYKEKFQKLLDYHKNHLDKDVMQTKIYKLNNYSFEYGEARHTFEGQSDINIEADIHDDGEWYLYVWRDGKSIDIDNGKGFENLLSLLGKYLCIPDKNSSEYQALVEWVDKNGNKLSVNSSAVGNQPEEVVYIWDMYIDPRDKGNWCSAEKNNNEYDGFVYATRVDARRGGFNHLCELEDEGQLRGDFSDYTVEAVAIPKSEVSDYTLRFSGL